MLSLRKRIKELQEKTSSVEAKSACKEALESFVNVPDSQLAEAIVNRLRNAEDSDKHVAKFIGVYEKMTSVSNLGVAKGIAKIKESQIYSYPAIKYGLSKIESSLINDQAPEYMVIDATLECIKTFVWDSVVENVYKELKEKRSNLDESIALSIGMNTMNKGKGSFMFDNIMPKIEEHFVNPTESSRISLMEDLKKLTFYPYAKTLLETLGKIQKTSGKGVQLVSENGKCTVSSIYSPLLMENGKEFFFVKGSYYSKDGNSITQITETESLPEKFREICRIISSPNVFITEGKISFYVKRNKVEILESEGGVNVTFNGNKITSNELAKNMVSAGLFRLEESKMAYDVQAIAESFNNIYDIDFGKVIESNVYPGSYAIIMKAGDSIAVSKVNESMRSNEFFSGLNATQARNIILEFVGYDIKESMDEYLEKDEVKLKELKESQLEILKNLSIVEANLEKVTTTLNDPFLSKSPELQEIKNVLESEIQKLKDSHKEISGAIKAFEKRTTSDVGYEIGDEVKLTESGDIATVSSINSSRDTVTVITGAGKTMEVSTNKISSLESQIAVAEEVNATGKKKQ
jgi:hypothetical protein